MEINGIEEGVGKEKEEEMKGFSERVYRVVKQVPKGKVATYGWVAAKLGNPRAARAVGNALHVNPYKSVPCYRVVNREGRIALNFGGGGWREQKRRLLKEGVEFKDRVYVDIKKHLWEVF